MKNIFKNIGIFFKNMLRNPCPKCGIGDVHYIGEDIPNSVWISVYACDTCKTEFC
jgi:hypothetical protein